MSKFRTPTRYSRQPRVGEKLWLSEDDQMEVVEVHARGRQIKVRDRLGRLHDLTRAEKGYWLIQTEPAPA